MTKYRWVNPDRLRRAPRTDVIDGVKITVGLSPYDVPSRVSGEYLKDKGTFEIHFDYSNDEPSDVAPRDFKGATIIEGRHTGKLLAIILPIDNPPLEKACIIELQTRLMAALTERAKFVHGIDREMNQQIAEEVLEENLADLVQQ